jgi:hypothetical protein
MFIFIRLIITVVYVCCIFNHFKIILPFILMVMSCEMRKLRHSVMWEAWSDLKLVSKQSTCLWLWIQALLCGELTGVLNKLRAWVWHSPKLQKGTSIVMPSKIARLIGTASAAEVRKTPYSCLFL